METPHDDNESLIKFYGNPAIRGWGDQLVKFTPPYRMLYRQDASTVFTEHGFYMHPKCLDAFTAAFAAIWNGFNNDQAAIDAAGMQWYGGCYNPRHVRGSSVHLSVHAFAAAIDINPDANPLGAAWNPAKMPQIVIDAFKSTGAYWGGDFHSRKDVQHFQYAHE